VLFLERDVPWYASQRDAPGTAELYASVDELQERFADAVREADLVIQGSYVPDGVEVGEWVTEIAGGATAFYDIDTPVTLAKLEAGDGEYLSPELVPRFDLYLSFTGGPTLDRLEHEYGARCARPLYCSVDPSAYGPLPGTPRRWSLGYLGTYSDDRQPTVEALLSEPARRLPDDAFAVAGPQYPPQLAWPPNVERIEHLAPPEHPAFYAAQAFTLNVTRADMIRAGWSPSVRLFEAAACATPVISDWWDGLDAFFEPGRELLVAEDADDVARFLRETPEEERRAIGERARERVLAGHTAERRAEELEGYVRDRVSA
jgi:spore maturation protein CgeB